MEFWHHLSLFTKENAIPLVIVDRFSLELIIFRLLSWPWNQIVLSTLSFCCEHLEKDTSPVPSPAFSSIASPL